MVFDGVHGAVGANDELFRVENAVASAVPVLAPMMTLRPKTRVGLSPDYTFKHLPLGARSCFCCGWVPTLSSILLPRGCLSHVARSEVDPPRRGGGATSKAAGQVLDSREPAASLIARQIPSIVATRVGPVSV